MSDADLERRAKQAAREIVRGVKRVCVEYARLLMAWWDKHKATFGVLSGDSLAAPLASAEEARALAEACLRDAREPTLTITTRDGSPCWFGAGELREGQEVQLSGADYGEEPVTHVVERVTERPHGTIAVMRRKEG